MHLVLRITCKFRIVYGDIGDVSYIYFESDF